MKRIYIIAASAIFSLSGCNTTGSAAAPSASTAAAATTALNGAYIGTIDDGQAGIGTATLTLTQMGDTFSGSYVNSFTNTSLTNTGTITGVITGSSINGTLISETAGACTYSFSGTVSGTKIAGEYITNASCSAPNSANVNLTQAP